MNRRIFSLFAIYSFAVLLSSCSVVETVVSEPTIRGMPNPASVFCNKHGGELEIRTAPDGGQYGVCKFPDRSECEEWAYYRGECKPGQTTLVSPPGSPTASVPAEGWSTYTHDTYDYTFSYPKDVEIRADNQGESLTLTGPLVDNEHWPMIFINHRSSEAFRPPAGVDLEQWLKDNNLLMGELKGERTIAGQTALQVFYKGGPGVYDQDTFFFAKGQQLFQIVLLHAGKQDWKIYNRFLDSFNFTQ